MLSLTLLGSAFPPLNEFFFVSRTCDGQNLTLPPELPSREMSATTNFITFGSTTADDGRISASNVLLPELHNPRRCLREAVLLVSAEQPQTNHSLLTRPQNVVGFST